MPSPGGCVPRENIAPAVPQHGQTPGHVCVSNTSAHSLHSTHMFVPLQMLPSDQGFRVGTTLDPSIASEIVDKSAVAFVKTPGTARLRSPRIAAEEPDAKGARNQTTRTILPKLRFASMRV
jgi:hypothetical protein